MPSSSKIISEIIHLNTIPDLQIYESYSHQPQNLKFKREQVTWAKYTDGIFNININLVSLSCIFYIVIIL